MRTLATSRSFGSEGSITCELTRREAVGSSDLFGGLRSIQRVVLRRKRVPAFIARRLIGIVMNEPRSIDEPPSALRAIGAIEVALRHEQALRSRTEGLTWIIWGLVMAPLVLVWQWPVVYQVVVGVSWVLATFLWVPWFLLGAAATWALWRTAAIASPSMEERPQAGLRVTLGYLLFAGIVWASLWFMAVSPSPNTIAMFTIGTVWLGFGALNPFHMTTIGRKVSLAVGALTLVVGLALVLALARAPSGGQEVSHHLETLVTLSTLTLLPFIGGLWQALRG